MDTNNEEIETSKLKHGVSHQTKASKPWLVWLLAGLVVLLLAASGYWWWQYKKVSDQKDGIEKNRQELIAQLADARNKDDKETQPAAKDANGQEEQVCNDTPTASRKENIKAALDSKNTAAFSTYFSNPVLFVIAASEKGGEETPDQAAVDMEYANTATGPWDFNLPPATVSDYDAGFYTAYFDSNTYVGRAASGQVAAFDFDCNGKIKQAFLAAHEDIL